MAAPEEPSLSAWIPAAGFAAAAAALFLPALLLGRLVYGADTLTLGLPLAAAVQRSLDAGQWPLWLPGVFGGLPGIASCNLSFLYPSDLAGALAGLPLAQRLALDAALHVVVAGLGMQCFLRGLGRSRTGAFLGALFFAVSGSVVSPVFGGYYNFVEGVALVPWLFWAAHKGARERSWFAWGLCGLFAGLQVLAVAVQTCAYALPAALAFAFCMKAAGPRSGRSWDWAALAGPALALLTALLVAAPQLWPTLQYLPLSAREGFTYAGASEGSIGLREALTWLVPGAFGWSGPTYHGAMADCFTTEYLGLLPWALAAAALAARRGQGAALRLFPALALAGFILGQRHWWPLWALFHALPVTSGFRIWSRALFLVGFSVCGLAAFGWDALMDRQLGPRALRGAAAFCGLALAAAALAWALAPHWAAAARLGSDWAADAATAPGRLAGTLTGLTRDSARTTALLAPLLLALLALASRRLAAGPRAGLLALGLALLFHVQDQGPVLARFVRFMDPADAVGHPRLDAPLPPPPALEPWRLLDRDASWPNNTLLQGYENLGGRESMPLAESRDIEAAMAGRPQDWLDLMNVRLLLAHSSTGSADPGDRVRVLANPGALGRAFLAESVRPVSGDAEAYRLLADPAFDPRRSVALQAQDLRALPQLSAPPPAGPPAAALGGASLPAAGGGRVRWLANSPQAFSLQVDLPRAQALVVSNPWHPSWRCQVDGRERPVLRADGGLQAVALDAGSHRVDVRFDGGLFRAAALACAAGLALLAALGLRDALPRMRAHGRAPSGGP